MASSPKNNSRFEKECIKEFGKLAGQIGIIHTEQGHMQSDIVLLKNDVTSIKERVMNGNVRNAAVTAETQAWTWIMRVGIVAIAGGLVTKLFALW